MTLTFAERPEDNVDVAVRIQRLLCKGLLQMDNIHSESRRNTPWTDEKEASPLERFIDECNHRNYENKHPKVRDTAEPELLNSYRPEGCRYCGSKSIESHGYMKSGIRRYICRSCRRTFCIMTGTIFDQRKIPITEWLDFILSILGYGSFRLTSKANRNAYNTTRYWMDKLFLLLRGWQDHIILNGRIYLDETFYSVRGGNRLRDENGKGLRGITRDKICIGVAYDGNNLICIEEGLGKTSGKRTLSAYQSHIEHGSVLIHDGEIAHGKLISALSLISEIHTSKETRGKKDSDNPLNPINQCHNRLKKFLNAHSGFLREDMQDYLNLYSFIESEPADPYRTIEILLDLALRKPILLRYRG